MGSHEVHSKSGGGMIAMDYPPSYHLLRDLGVWLERDERGSRAGLEIDEHLCSPNAGVRSGVIATLVDVIGGATATRAVRPGWVATCDLVLHLVSAVRKGPILAGFNLLRQGKSTVVIETEITAPPQQRTIAHATLTFSVLEARNDMQRIDERADQPRVHFGGANEGLDEPLVDRLGCRILDAETGRVELELNAYNSNTLGAVQGGALAILADVAAESAGRAAGRPDWVTTDLTIHYLALGRHGPIRTTTRLLRSLPASALVRVEIRDAGAADRLVCVATATVEAAHFV